MAAVLLMPPFTKFYIALCPLVALTQAYRYVDVPSQGRLACMAGAIVFALAYRLDVGLWSIVLCVSTIGLVKVKTGRSLCLLLCYAVALSAPWWIYLFFHGALWEYVLESTYYSVDLAKGLELPFPRFDSTQRWFATSNLGALSFIAIYPASLFMIAALLYRRGELEVSTRRYLYIALLLAGSALLQTMHRSDYSHLRQGLTGFYLLLALIMWMAWRDCVGGSSQVRGWPLKTITLLVTCFGLIAVSLPIAWGGLMWAIAVTCFPTSERLEASL